MKKVCWIKTDGSWYLSGFPFFDTRIRIRDYGTRKIYYEWHGVAHNNLGAARKELLNDFLELEPASKFSEISPLSRMSIIERWPNNLGNGWYVHLYKQKITYKWLQGQHQFWRSPCNWYSIRFPRETPNDEIERIAVKLFNRHLNRFKKQYHDIDW